MKKVSAFSVFQSKNKKSKASGDEADLESRKSSLRRASSTPAALDEKSAPGSKDSATKGKRLLKVLKSGSLRGSIRSSSKKRSSILPNDSPYVAGDKSCELTAMKQNGIPASNSTLSLNSIDGKTGSSPKSASKTKKISKEAQSKTSPSNKNGLPPRIPKQTKSPAKQSTKRKLNTLESSGKKKKRQEDRADTSLISGVTALPDADDEDAVDAADDTIMQNVPYMYDSSAQARKTVECLIHPLTTERFFSELWERKPLLVKRHIPHYNDGWFSTAELDRILREENIQFSVNIDVTTFEKGKRETHNIPGRAYAPVVWDYFQNGCSVRLLNPQTYSRNVWKLLAIMQEYFGCFVGANVYLTPAGSQGFAPHFDDIEAFIIQLEGKKHWKLYSPRDTSEILPRVSSDNLNEEDLGEPILDVTLEAGDMLYFPRGTIHQAHTTSEDHSLHITISCYQKNTYGDLLEKTMTQALQTAIEENVDFRRGLPRDYLNYMGVVNSDKASTARKEFLKKMEQLMSQMFKYSRLDAACDQMGKSVLTDALPPLLTEGEKSCSVHGSGEHWDQERKGVIGTIELEPDTTIKIIRRGVLRLITEEDMVRVYHCLENSRVYHGAEVQYIDIAAEAAPAVEYLIHAYPEYVTIDSLPLDNLKDRIDIAQDLYDRGLLITGDQLEPIYEESDCDDT